MADERVEGRDARGRGREEKTFPGNLNLKSGTLPAAGERWGMLLREFPEGDDNDSRGKFSSGRTLFPGSAS